MRRRGSIGETHGHPGANCVVLLLMANRVMYRPKCTGKASPS